jgi:peptidoglycan DL-endopeptidase CwlO
VAAGVLTAGLVATSAGSAAAAPTPTVAQVRHKIEVLETKASKLGQQFIQAQQELASANARLKLVNEQVARYQVQFDKLRSEVGRIAVTSYEDGNLSSPIGLLTSGNPQQILDQASILSELSSADAAEMHQFLAAAKQLANAQEAARRTEKAILQLRNGLRKRKNELDSLLAKQKALLQQLTPQQQKGLGPGGGGGGGDKYKGPTSTQAEKAVAYAYSKIGCPYLWGGTGPCNPGFDCSGLTMMAWASAGVSIPRTSYEQWDELPHVSTSDLQPGDILVFNGASHVGIYVGDNELIDAPQTGMDVEKIPLTGWYAQTLDGAVLP